MVSRRDLLLIYVVKYMLKKEYGNKEKHEFLNRTYNSKSYLRRKRFLASFIGLTMSEINSEPRSIWAYERGELWFNRMLNFDEHWKNDFWMTRNTFLKIVKIVQPVIEKRDTQFRRVVTIEKRVAIALWRLSTGNSFRTTPKTFAVGKSTAVQITRDFCSEIQRVASEFIKFLKLGGKPPKISIFVLMPNTWRIRHIRWYSYSNYRSMCWRKSWFLLSKAVLHDINSGYCWCNLVFLDVATGFPGRYDASGNLRNTSLFRRAENRNSCTARRRGRKFTNQTTITYFNLDQL